jgi:hypothetical protein
VTASKIERALVPVVGEGINSEWEEAGLLDSADVTRVLAEMRWLGTKGQDRAVVGV